jgi:hypothetical protein
MLRITPHVNPTNVWKNTQFKLITGGLNGELLEITERMKQQRKEIWLQEQLENNVDISKYLEEEDNEINTEPAMIDAERPVIILFFSDVKDFMQSLLGDFYINLLMKNGEILRTTTFITIDTLENYFLLPPLMKTCINDMIFLDPITSELFNHVYTPIESSNLTTLDVNKIVLGQGHCVFPVKERIKKK